MDIESHESHERNVSTHAAHVSSAPAIRIAPTVVAIIIYNSNAEMAGRREQRWQENNK